MSEIFLSSLAKTNANWLSVRQSLIAGNVANANTPGFAAKDVKPLEHSGTSFASLVRTHGKHQTASLDNVAGVGTTKAEGWEVFHSGNNVSLPNEMLKSAEVRSAYELNVSVMRSFHRMVNSVFGA